MDIRYIGGIIESTTPSSAEIVRGRIVKRDATGWIHAGDDERGVGISTQSARKISSGFNIYASSYNEGLASTYDGRRNPYKVTYANVGDPIGVLVGTGNVLENVDQFIGNVSQNALLCSAASGIFKATTNRDLAIAQVLVGGNKANSEKLTIVTI